MTKKLTMQDELDPELQALIKRLKDNFMICIVKRNGGEMRFPVAEIDGANDLMEMEIDGTDFVLRTTPRQ